MKTGTISRILDYYYSSPHFRSAFEQAIKFFFEISAVEQLSQDKTTATEQGLFNEWFLYDFLLPTGDTPLEHYIDVNPDQLTERELDLYKKIRDTQQYSIFEVTSVQLGSALTLRDIRTNTIYQAQERAATYQVHIGNLVPQRVAMIEDHWELLGANTIVIPLQLNDKTRATFKNSTRKNPTVQNQLTPKTVRQWLAAYDTTKTSAAITPATAEERLAQALQDYHIEQMISASTVKRWTYEFYTKKHPTLPIMWVIGLVDKDDFQPDNLHPLASAVMDVMNTCPHRELDGKSPNDVMTKRTAAGHSPQFKTNTTEIGGKWLQLYQQAYEHMADGNMVKAIRSYDAVFRILLTKREVDGQIYRMFTNAAIAYFAYGEKLIGKKLVELALQLNPNYDFGRLTLTRLETGVFEKDMKLARQRRQYTKKTITILPWRAHPALAYFNWLVTLGINFKTDELTSTPVIDLN